MSATVALGALQDVVDCKISPAAGANKIASEGLQQQKPADVLYELWMQIIKIASGSLDPQERLVELLVSLSQEPDAYAARGQPLKVYGAQVWSDLPTFGWQINDIWDSLSVPTEQPQRSQSISSFVDEVHFTALLIKTGQSVFQRYRLQILWTFRPLESPTNDPNSEAFKNLDINIPAISTVVDVLGRSIATWNDEYESGPLIGAPGEGGPLWSGKQGFSTERCGLWKKRLIEISQQDGVDTSIQNLAADTARKM